MKNLEQELKLSLTEREYNILLAQCPVQPQEQINYYFSPKVNDLSTMVRLRKKGDSFLLCYKRRLTHTNGVMVSNELEQEIAPDYAQNLISRGITKAEMTNFFRMDFYDDFAFVGTLTTYRSKFQLEEWTLELDKNLYFDTCDYELECESNQIQSLEKLKSYLAYHFGVVLCHSKTKYERFLTKFHQLRNEI